MARIAAAGEPEALWRHARLLQNRATTAQSLAEAITALRAAAHAGAVPAMAELGRNLAMGAGVARNETEALEWLDKAATGGDSDAADLARWLRLR